MKPRRVVVNERMQQGYVYLRTEPPGERFHPAQLEKHCARRDLACRPRQRQSLLHWAYDSRLI
ncbi:MAG TPA: hypothetical protein VHG88_07840 [Burkholderiales bacterium]|nr:hypothetical protein [Burkholderiales bacterium]